MLGEGTQAQAAPTEEGLVMANKLQPGSRASRALALLARHPDGLLTPQIAQALGEYPWALVALAQVLRREEGRGSVTSTRQGPGTTVLWRITSDGESLAGDQGTMPAKTRAQQIRAYFDLLMKLAQDAEGARREDLLNRIERTLAAMEAEVHAAKRERCGTGWPAIAA